MIVLHESKPIKRAYYSKVHSRHIVTDADGTQQCQLWEQWLPLDGYIVRHQHENEELITILAGKVGVTLGEQKQVVQAPATVFIPAKTQHSFRNVGDEPVHLLAFFATGQPTVTYALDDPPQPVQWDQ